MVCAVNNLPTPAFCTEGKSWTIKGLLLLHLLLPCLRPRGSRHSQRFQGLPCPGEQAPSQLT